MKRQRFHILWSSAALCLFWGAGSCLAQSRLGDHEAIQIDEVRSAGGVTLIVENLKAHDITVRLTIHSTNARVMHYKMETDTYPGKSRTQALFIHQDDKTQTWSWRYRTRWVKGDIHAKHNEFVVYRLPFENNKSFRVIQSYHGSFSHQGTHEYTVDFAMREGTSVCAAREGQVVDVQDKYEKGGMDSRPANVLGIRTVPTMILVDKQGKVVNRNVSTVELESERVRPVDIPTLCGDNTKAGEVLGWRPEIPLEDTIRWVLDSWRAKIA